jgi:hypothetical protein
VNVDECLELERSLCFELRIQRRRPQRLDLREDPIDNVRAVAGAYKQVLDAPEEAWRSA